MPSANWDGAVYSKEISELNRSVLIEMIATMTSSRNERGRYESTISQEQRCKDSPVVHCEAVSKSTGNNTSNNSECCHYCHYRRDCDVCKPILSYPIRIERRSWGYCCHDGPSDFRGNKPDRWADRLGIGREERQWSRAGSLDSHNLEQTTQHMAIRTSCS